jgi:ribosome-associated toxin RatA of RatAB toxin-antitoxin module
LAIACLITGLLSGAGTMAQTEFRDIKPDDVTVVFGSEQIEISLDTQAPVTPAQAWAVLTDYEHMSQFLPGLELSEVSSRQGNVLRVRQRGSTRAGILHFDYENVRDVNLTPQRLITTHGVSGDVKRLDSSTELRPREGGVQLHYHVAFEPARPLPSFLGNSALKRQTADNFNAFIREMIRRQENAPRRSTAGAPTPNNTGLPDNRAMATEGTPGSAP